MADWGQILEPPMWLGDAEYNFGTLEVADGWPDVGQSPIQVQSGITIQLAAGQTEFEFECNIGFEIDGVPYAPGRHIMTGQPSLTDINMVGDTVQQRAAPTFRFWNTYDTIQSIVLNVFGTVETMSYSFFGLTNLTTFDCPTTPNVVTNIGYAWADCSGLLSFPAMDTSKVTYLRAAWQSCSSLTTFPIIDVSSTTSLRDAWRSCTGMTSFPALEVGHITEFLRTFYAMTSMTSFPAMDYSSGTAFTAMFQVCSNLVCFAGTIDTRNGITFTAMLGNCPNLVQPDAQAQIDLVQPGGALWTNAGACP